MTPQQYTPKSVHWRLPVIMATRGIKSATELHRRLRSIGVEISSAQLSRMMYRRPQRLSMDLLDALITVLECDLADLLAVGEPGAEEESVKQPAANRRQRVAPAPAPNIAGPKVTPFPVPPPKGKV